ncbi:MAG: cytochrome c [Pseudomonadota bacterium]
MRNTFICLALCAARLAWAAPAAPANLAAPATIAAGQKRFNQNCVYCHGNAGSGGKGAPLQGRTDLAPAYLFDTISNGKIRGALQMPPWKDAFSEQEIWELAAYIHSLRQPGAR